MDLWTLPKSVTTFNYRCNTMHMFGPAGQLSKLVTLQSKIYIYRKSVVNIVVLEGPSVQNIYQQVIRDFPGLVGAGWESRRRQVYS